MAKERMDFYAIVSIFDVIFRFIIALIISLTDYDSLFIYGILLFRSFIGKFLPLCRILQDKVPRNEAAQVL